ncbi:hypothetical protein [Sphingobium olei]|uniref:Exonuclease domain-containing protein n=1 Tax=Sphingobium olei TaxID=420955 RepID=A0ABW3NWM3_9SPHN|nr:hypothetical protein [Sphingobium sp.]
MSVIAIDFEASCLPRHGRSFPIEVGIAGEGGARSWVIRPHDDWAGWDWTAEAEALHGLSRDRVEREGLPADRVFEELENAVWGRRLIADSLIDQYWMTILAQAAGVRSAPKIDHIAAFFDELAASEEHITAAVARADALGVVRHRAAGDAIWLAAVIAHVSRAGREAPAPLLEAAQ